MEKITNHNQPEKSSSQELNRYTYHDHSKGRDHVMFECLAPSVKEADLVFEKQFKKHPEKLSQVGRSIEKIESGVPCQIKILPHEKFIELYNGKKKHANDVPSPAASMSIRQGEKINIKSMIIDQSFLPAGEENEYAACLFIHEMAEAKYYEHHLELYVKALERVNKRMQMRKDALETVLKREIGK